MKYSILKFIILIICLVNTPAFSQADKEPKALNLPGDNLDLYAVLDLFQKSKTIEDFETSLNSEKNGINNLDLDTDKKIDFIKVVTKKDGDSFSFILQDAISKKETQDVAVILVSKDKNGNYAVQIVGDEALYGKNYIVEPIASETSVTPNPAYKGQNPVTTTKTATVAVQSSPVIVYLYSPVYVPYVPPYYYGFYPPYFHPWAPIYFSMYYHNHYYHHAHYHNTVVIHNSGYYNRYATTYRHSSVTVSHYNTNGNYRGTYQGNNYKRPSTLPSNGIGNGNRASTLPANRANQNNTMSRQTSRPTNAAARPAQQRATAGARRR